MVKLVLLIAAICAVSVGVKDVPVPAPSYAPAPTTEVNGASAYTCPSPGSTGYLFEAAPCNFGRYAGLAVYCDQSTEGIGYVGIRSLSETKCAATSDCTGGEFCSAQTSVNGTCTPVADDMCFAGALAPAPSPGPALLAPTQAPASSGAVSFPVLPTTGK